MVRIDIERLGALGGCAHQYVPAGREVWGHEKHTEPGSTEVYQAMVCQWCLETDYVILRTESVLGLVLGGVIELDRGGKGGT